ncbi:P60-like protein [Tothia fuscella]|uniref:Ribosome biogenesis protein NOP53 n=1 Tax=Tothia fuscella TaxID=1048955 RepID=A0A9P4NJM6_9PEZI|nr:P60-like protein [Tothia fuscella]
MADPIVLPPQQHSQPSRKGKKAWRKNVNVTEVESGLEEVREEIIKGGIISEKPSSELFATDLIGSTTIKQKFKTAKLLKADEILARRSTLPSVDNKKRGPSNPNITDGVIEPSSKRHKKNGVSPKELERLRKIAYGGDTTHKDVVQTTDADYDPWSAPLVVSTSQFSFLEKKQEAKVPKTLKMAPMSLAKNGKAIPAVAKPEAGKSYNPTFADWNTVVERETAIAVSLEEKRLDDVRKEEELQERIRKAQEEEEKQNESAWESEWESEWEGIVSEREEESKNDGLVGKKLPKRKTQAERNKIKRRKVEEQRKVQEEKIRKREGQVGEAKALLKAFRAREKARAEKGALPESDTDDFSVAGEEIELRRRRLGKGAIPDAPLEVVLADELQESLRLLKPEGNLLKDRFRSMMLRGKVESRTPIWQHKKAKVTATEKWSYKDWKLK